MAQTGACWVWWRSWSWPGANLNQDQASGIEAEEAWA